MASKIIKPEEVLKAYKKIGYKPIRLCFCVPNTKKCCAISALIMSQGVPEGEFYVNSVEYLAYKHLGMLKDHFWLFISGFDAGSFDAMLTPNLRRSKHFKAGVESWQFVSSKLLQADKKGKQNG